jgi:uncharacterized protein YneF (UPF0154 family)
MGFMSFVLGLAQPTVTPVVQVAKPHGEITVADVLVNIVSLIGVLGVLIILIGLITGGLFIMFRRWRDERSDAPPLAEYTQLRLSTGPSETPTPAPTSTPRS